MKKVVCIAIAVVFCASTAGAWEVKVKDGAKTKPGSEVTMNALSECVFIDINSKTQIKVCKCGSVSVQEWKEIVPNKEQNGVLILNSTGSYTVPADPRWNDYITLTPNSR